jgi:anti-sigma-K factor RskA
MPAEQSNLCDDIQPWLVAYALGEADEEAASRAHLLACPRCQHDLHEYQLVAGMLPYAAPEAIPRPELREQLIASIKRQAAEAAPVAAPVPASPEPEIAAVEPLQTAPAAPAPSRRQPRRSRSFWAAFAFAALAVALLAWNLRLQGENEQQRAQVALNRQNWQTMIGLLNDTSLRWYMVAGGAAHGHFWAVPRDQVACLIVQGLPALAEGQVYQVWLIHNSWPSSGGTFEAHDGNAWALVHTDEPLAQYSGVFVTIEPDGGSPTPRGPQVVSGALSLAMVPGSADRQELLGLLGSARPWGQ